MKTFSLLITFVTAFVVTFVTSQHAAISAGRVIIQAPGVVAPAVPGPVFRQMAMISDAFEIESSRLALSRSLNPAVRRFAQRMIVDHVATAQAIMGGVPLTPGMALPLDARHAALLAQLQSVSGRQFDRLYATVQLQAHQEAVGLFQSYAVAGSDPAWVNFARQSLPILQQHLAMAARLARRA